MTKLQWEEKVQLYGRTGVSRTQSTGLPFIARASQHDGGHEPMRHSTSLKLGQSEFRQ